MPSLDEERRFDLLPFINEIEEMVQTARLTDSRSHAALLEKIRALQLAAEEPMDTISRIGHAVSFHSFF